MNRTNICVIAALLSAIGCKGKDKPPDPKQVTGSGSSGSGAGSAAGSGSGSSTATAPAAGSAATGLDTGATPTVSKAQLVADALDADAREQAALARQKPATPTNIASLNRPDAQDLGDFKLVKDPSSKGGPLLAAVEKRLNELIPALNQALKLPRDVPVIMGECGEPNAFYIPSKHLIVMCDEYPVEIAKRFGHKGSQDAIIQAMLGKVTATFLHELGHALIGEHSLPITGKEEDAADQIAMFFLLTPKNDATDQIALLAAEYWLAVAVERGDGPAAYWDSHSLDEQRFYNMICLVLGSNPTKFDYLEKEGIIPEERASWCPREWKQVKDSFTELLEPYTHKPT